MKVVSRPLVLSPFIVALVGLITTVGVITMGTVKGLEAQANTAGVVSFTKDVAPILQGHCQRCHRPESSAPMSLLTYQDARPWARSIKTKVAAREMPPWFID